MTERAKVVLRGFLELSREEQDEVLRQIDRLHNSKEFERIVEKKQLDESAERFRINAGPVKNPCPCCGRG